MTLASGHEAEADSPARSKRPRLGLPRMLALSSALVHMARVNGNWVITKFTPA